MRTEAERDVFDCNTEEPRVGKPIANSEELSATLRAGDRNVFPAARRWINTSAVRFAFSNFLKRY
jgi:hypothetical protein